DALQVIHANNGYGLVHNYLNPYYLYDPNMSPVRIPAPTPGSVGDSGTIDTVMFQYMLRLVPLLDLPVRGRDLTLAVFGMSNHVKANMIPGGKQDKFKFGSELEASVLRYLALGVRFDRVMPNGNDTTVAYSAISPRLIIHSSWMSREYLLLSYTRYFLGSALTMTPTTTYDHNTYLIDKNLFLL